MKPMVWHPEERDKKVNQYLDKINHAPYQGIIAFLMITFCLLTFVILIGIF